MNDRILFLCCCSNKKLAGGERTYNPTRSMPLAVPRHSRDLLEARHTAFQHIHNGATSVRGTLLRDLPYNADSPLSPGPDLGGDTNGRYMPAVARYRGRFYQELDPDEHGVLGESPHHWLITSALYGLLTPEEPIQRYSCHTLDDREVTKVWINDGLLTSLLLEYVRVFDVGLVVDLTADASYHRLFDWEKIAARTGVLRAFGAQNAGPALLPALGFLVRDRLLHASAEEMFGVAEHRTYITDYEDVVLTRSYSDPPEPFLGEYSPPEEMELPDDEGRNPSEPPQPRPDPNDECIVLPRPRDIRVTSDDHGTIFGHPITHIRDLPPDARLLFDRISRAAEVLDVRLGPFRSSGRRSDYTLHVALPGTQGDGTIAGKLRGPGRIGGVQELRIRVTRASRVGHISGTHRTTRPTMNPAMIAPAKSFRSPRLCPASRNPR